MSTDLVVTSSNALSIVDTFASDLELAEHFAKNARAENTKRAYISTLMDFAKYCQAENLQPVPVSPETIVSYISHLAKEHKFATVKHRLTLLGKAFRRKSIDFPAKHPAIEETLQGIRRSIGIRQDQKAPLLVDDLRRMLATLPPGLLGIRDKAIILIGWAGAFRRSEVVSLDVEDLDFSNPKGVIILLRRSKTDQAGEGMTRAIPFTSSETCPVSALTEWLKASGIKTGPIFRPLGRAEELQEERLSDKAVARIVQRTAKNAGLNAERLAGHSLRAGMATQAALEGVGLQEIMSQTGHKDVKTAMKYIRNADPFKANPISHTGL